MLPAQLKDRLVLPVLASPMFLVSGPDLVIEACRAGVIGTFPTLNQRTAEGYEDWLRQIRRQLKTDDAPFGVQCNIHYSNERQDADLALTVKYQAPIVVTTLVITREVTDAIHGYGGLVFHDATTVHHAKKALDANVDGVIAVAAGAGGHAGAYNPFAFISEMRAILADKTLILAGAVSTGYGIAGAIAAGADLVSVGTAFINTEESMASAAMKQMIIDSSARDIVYTDKVSGVPANFLRKTLRSDLQAPEGDFSVAKDIVPKKWKDIWTAGHGVGSVHDVVPAAQLVRRLTREYQAAGDRLATRMPPERAAQLAGSR